MVYNSLEWYAPERLRMVGMVGIRDIHAISEFYDTHKHTHERRIGVAAVEKAGGQGTHGGQR